MVQLKISTDDTWHFIELKKTKTTGLKQLTHLPEDVPLSMSEIPRELDNPWCGSDRSVCLDSSPRWLEGLREAQTALKIPERQSHGAVG